MKPPVLPDEPDRQRALDGLRIVDTDPERAYDDITLIASQICATPISVISFVDNGRQWFKSTIGLERSGTHRDISFCAHTIATPDIMEVHDAAADHRFDANPLVTGDPGIRFYAGVALTEPGGQRVGALCVIDREPRNLTQAQRDALEALGRSVSTLLELRVAGNRLRQALDDVHHLSGLIPICMHCKSIRSDSGFWERLERYIEGRSDVRFSHGVCPDCAHTHYSEFFPDAAR